MPASSALKAASTPSEPVACGAGGAVFFGSLSGLFVSDGAGLALLVFVVRCRSVVVGEFVF